MKYKLIGLYIVFFIIIFLIDNFVVINRIYSDHKQPYRLGDAIRKKSSRDTTLYTPKKYKYSIASEYMNKNKDKDYKFNIDLLNNIVKKRTKIRHKLYGNYINVHLRTGDVITEDYKKYLNSKYKSKPPITKSKTGWKNPNYYTEPLSYYEKVIKYLKKNNIRSKNVLIVTGWPRFNENTKNNSLKYIEEIKKLFKKNGYKVTTRLNEDPDEDFIIMSNSKYFVQSGGGYSRLISQMVDLNGNTVINEDTIK